MHKYFLPVLMVGVVVESIGLTGCGSRGRNVVVEDPGLQGAVSDLELAIHEAKADMRRILNWQATRKSERDEAEGEEGPLPDQLMLESIQVVESAAKQLVRMAAGTNLQSDAQAMLAESEALVKKAREQVKPAELMPGLDQLKAKVQESKSKI